MSERGSHLAMRLATLSDDPSIRLLLRNNPMPGSISFAFAHEPSFFDAVQVEGNDATVIVGELNGEVKGTGLVAKRRVYVGGKPTTIGYLSSLRIDSSLQGSTALARGYRLLGQLHRNVLRLPFYLTTIMEDNDIARAILTSGRAGLPAYTEVGKYLTFCVPLLPWLRLPTPSGLRIASGAEVGTPAIAEYLSRHHDKRELWPAYSEEDVVRRDGILRGLGPRDFVVAMHRGDIVGTVAAWDQMAFRQNVVTGYSAFIKTVRPVVNLLGRSAGIDVLPEPGRAVNGLMAACVAIRGDDLTVFRALLGRLITEARGRGKSYVYIGLAADDPLTRALRGIPHITLNSLIYLVTWDCEPPVLSGAPIYLEAGSL